jgi:hypothetical protein
LNMERYPADLQISAADFKASGWRDVMAGAPHEGYSSIWHDFSNAARKAIDEGRQAHGKVLWLLADACSMMLSPQSLNEPFKPFMVMDGKRSVIPDDLLDSDLTFFAEVIDDVDEPWIKARLCDLVWLRRKPRDVKFALSAIDAYRTIPIDTKTWVRGGRECWARAISLVRMLKSGAGDRLNQMESAVVGALLGAQGKDGFLAVWLADLAAGNGLGRNDRTNIAQHLEFLAREYEAGGDLHRARSYFKVASDWHERAGDQARSAEMTVAMAESWVREAIANSSSGQPSNLVAATFYEKAIQIYRTIPRAERVIHRVDDRVSELRAHLNEAGKLSLGEMGMVKTPGVDIGDLVENARNAVRGKAPLEALKSLANVFSGANAKDLRSKAIERLRSSPLQALFGASVMSQDGRVIAKRPGMSLGGTLTEDDEVAIRADMIRDYGILLSIVVQGDIWPALEVMLLEHRLREADFVTLAEQSPVVPPGRERLFGKALFSGYDRDFVSAIHLLVPQIEHMVRFHLKQAGATTTNLDGKGIENENGLATLMELPEADKIFGEDLAFEIRALFCDAFGPNLRNELAHGLLDDQACNSVSAIYAWWFGLRLVFNAYWLALQAANNEKTQGEKNGQE